MPVGDLAGSRPDGAVEGLVEPTVDDGGERRASPPADVELRVCVSGGEQERERSGGDGPVEVGGQVSHHAG